MTTDTGTAHSTSDALSYENSVYRGGNTDIKQQGHARDTDHDSSTDRIFNNPIYGGYDEEADNIYADVDTNYGLEIRMESSDNSDYKFDNPIYSWEDNAHSIKVILSSPAADKNTKSEAHH